MVAGRMRLGSLAVALMVPSGCALLSVSPSGVPPRPTADAASRSPAIVEPGTSPSVPLDGPVPSTLRAAVPSARRFLEDRWAAAGESPASFRFVGGRCAIGAAGVLVFELLRDGVPQGFAIAGTHDIAAGIVSSAWWSAFAERDPLEHPVVRRVLHGRDIACP